MATNYWQSAFEDRAFLEFCYENFDCEFHGGPQAGFLSGNEIQAVRSIDCSNRGIRSLEGIEIFTNLDTLICSGNLISSLNLSRTNIKVLWCNPMQAPDGSNLLEYLFIRRGQEIEFITSNRDKASPSRIPDQTVIIAVPAN